MLPFVYDPVSRQQNSELDTHVWIAHRLLIEDLRYFVVSQTKKSLEEQPAAPSGDLVREKTLPSQALGLIAHWLCLLRCYGTYHDQFDASLGGKFRKDLVEILSATYKMLGPIRAAYESGVICMVTELLCLAVSSVKVDTRTYDIVLAVAGYGRVVNYQDTLVSFAEQVFEQNVGYTRENERHLFVIAVDAMLRLIIDVQENGQRHFSDDAIGRLFVIMTRAAEISLRNKYRNCGAYVDLPWLSTLVKVFNGTASTPVLIPSTYSVVRKAPILQLLAIFEASIETHLITGTRAAAQFDAIHACFGRPELPPLSDLSITFPSPRPSYSDTDLPAGAVPRPASVFLPPLRRPRPNAIMMSDGDWENASQFSLLDHPELIGHIQNAGTYHHVERPPLTRILGIPEDNFYEGLSRYPEVGSQILHKAVIGKAFCLRRRRGGGANRPNIPPRPARRSPSFPTVSPPTQRGMTSPKIVNGSFTGCSDHGHLSPYLREDLNNAEGVPLDSWVNALFTLPAGGLRTWVSMIACRGWFNDKEIQSSLAAYCQAQEQDERYQPFTTLSNRILELARGTLAGVGKTYPVDDFCFVKYNRPVDTIRDHDGLDAVRKPDVLGVRKTVARKLFTKDGGKTQATVRWTDILVVVELKLRNKTLTESLQEAKKLRKKTRNSAQKLSHDPPLQALTNEQKGLSPQGDLLHPLHEENIYPSAGATETSETAPVGAAVQTASYALEVLSCTYGTRQFCLSIILKDEAISLWYYDASGIVYTADYISIVKNFEVFAAIIVGFACCTPERFGVFPTSVLKPHIPYTRQFPQHNLEEGTIVMPHPVTKQQISVTMDQCIFAQYILIGRRTFLYTVDTDPMISKNKLIMKVSYQVTTRRKEYELVALAKKKKVRHLPQIHLWGDLWQLSDGVRDLFLKDNEKQVHYEDRVLRAIVYTRYSSIKPLFTDNPLLIPVMVDQMIDCLSDLWYKANILHRDVSVNNIMYEKRGNYYHFVLIDFDMAIELVEGDASDYSPTSKHRTGTLPFMAHELIGDAYVATMVKYNTWVPTRHVLYHDFQSLFWVAIWCGLVLFRHTLSQDERKTLLAFLKRWENNDMDTLQHFKSDLMRTLMTTWRIPIPAPILPLMSWFAAWKIAFGTVSSAQDVRQLELLQAAAEGREPAPFDEDTIGGSISPQILKNTLSPYMPFKQSESEAVEDAEEMIVAAALEGLATNPAPLATTEEKDEATMHNAEEQAIGAPEASTEEKIQDEATCAEEQVTGYLERLEGIQEEVNEAVDVLEAPTTQGPMAAEKEEDETAQQALNNAAVPRQTRAATKKRTRDRVDTPVDQITEGPAAKRQTRATTKKRAGDTTGETDPVALELPGVKRHTRSTAKKKTSEPPGEPVAAKRKTRATAKKKTADKADETPTHLASEAPAPKPPPQRLARKRARPQEQVVAAENDVRARLRPRRRLA
ncbi:hypothetical protein NM688_g1320 [Phlebia brevispora]|uniref:Uncharacterized protein n=1 Tax=Phlebia brevispora TaxID=194682 RepID=A0ACC1TBU3_9APHY|nr:hypothetical protein NM688_g1320 [Phlebia brevispora]